ncbi:MAG: HAD family hydrolase [Promethearchaeota archaeon]
MFQEIKATLFDLDETLIQYDVTQFIRKYVQKASEYFLDVLDSEKFGLLFLQVARHMFRNPGTKTNVEFFTEEFCKIIPISTEETLDRFQIFYETDFPKLKDLVRPEPFAAEVLETCRECGFLVVIATNPVFPEIAIKTRLSWVLNSNFEPDFITTGDNMHTTKYIQGYFEEILSHINLKPSQCIMIGNSIKEDIIPAKKAGMRTFLTIPYGTEAAPNQEADLTGTLEDLLKKLQEFQRHK